MNLFDYTVLGGIAAAVLGVIIWLVRKKIQGKNCCGGCGGKNCKSCKSK